MAIGTALMLGAVLHASAVPIDFIDDAYISFRYAWNLSHGNGLAFNPGEAVEGYSNLTWVLAASALLKLGAPLEPAIRCTGVLLMAATALVLSRLLRTLGASTGLSAAAAFLLLSTGAWVLPTLNGLEGPLFSLLLLAITSLHWRNVNGGTKGSAMATGALGVLLAATRPEGYLLFIAQATAAATASALKRELGAWRVHALSLGTFALGFSALALWRLETYGSFVSNAVRAKLGPELFGRFLSLSLRGGLQYGIDFFLATFPLWLLTGAAIAWAWRRVGSATPALTSLLALAVIPWGIGMGVVLANNGDWMPHYRLLAPYIPLLILVAGALLIGAPHRAIIAVPLICAAVVAPAHLTSPSLSHLVHHQPSDFHRAWCRLGADLQAAAASPEHTVVAVEVLGVFSYCAPQLRVRDLSGLTDHDIASHEPSGGVFGRKTRPTTLEAMRPDAIVLNDLKYWRQLLSESAWFRDDLRSLSCAALLADQVYAFVDPHGAVAAGAIPSCAVERMPTREAFQKASCLQKSWPYQFPRDCNGMAR